MGPAVGALKRTARRVGLRPRAPLLLLRSRIELRKFIFFNFFGTFSILLDNYSKKIKKKRISESEEVRPAP